MTSAVFKFIPLMGVVLVSACAGVGSDYDPVLDGPAGPGYQADLADCQAVARDHRYDDERGAATLAGVGLAGLAVLADGDFDDPGEAAVALALGGLLGAGAGAAEAGDARSELIVQCLRGRGHKALG